MKKLFMMSLAAAGLAAPSYASQTNSDEGKALFKSHVPKAHYETLTKYFIHQAETIEAERALKAERRKKARRVEVERLQKNAERLVEQEKLPTVREYSEACSKKYIDVFMPFVKRLNKGERPKIPEILKPSTDFLVPHRNGVLHFSLKGASSACNAFTQDVAVKFLHEVVGKSTCKNSPVHDAIFFERNPDHLRAVLSKWLGKAVRDYQTKAQNQNELRKLLMEYSGAQQMGAGIAVDPLNMFTMKDAQLSAAFQLASTPSMYVLTDADIKSLNTMVATVKMVKLQKTDAPEIQVLNFQGVQY